MDGPSPRTGLPDLDRVLGGLRPGDNVVWQVESVDDYARLVGPLVERALAGGRPVVYFRFARHAPLVPEGSGVEVHRVSPSVGFESFTSSIHRVIEARGRGATYVFDCLSDLAADWHSDLMLGNFFRVTCPYLYELETLTYFALQRDGHSPGAVSAIRDTTQLLVDVFRHGRATCVHPLKVLGRHSPTMYLPHVWEGTAFRPITESAVVAEALAAASVRRDDPLAGLDVWDRRILQAREVAEGIRAGRRPWEDAREVVAGLVRMMLSRDERFAAMAEAHLDIDALLAVRRRMIGTGLVGGKAAGMLLARAILAARDPAWRRRLEPHDSWFVGSDVFYTYLVRNGLWRSRRRGRRDRDAFLAGAAEVRERILAGRFPDFVVGQLVAMLESYGQSPIIVRSSSLLEDGFGNAFTGKYESVFCPNQGDPAERLEAFLAAVRRVYASTMSEEALQYRADRGLLDRDEQMAVLVQRVSGAVHGRLFYPQVAGVALSYNPYVWSAGIDPDAGVVRLVFGMGTRAVDRADDDYTRIVALNAPRLRPEGNAEGAAGFAQRRVDVIDLEANRFSSLDADEVLRQSPELPVDLFATRRAGGDGWTLGFDGLLWGTPLVGELRALLGTLRDAYRYPVDVEFTANHLAGGDLRINLVQCRPLQVKEGGHIVPPPRDLDPADVVLASRGPVIGRSTLAPVDRVVFVDPDAYAGLGTQDRHEVARVVGRITRAGRGRRLRVLLAGPGRWGTTTPSLGVPVSFAEIRPVAAICEVMSIGNVVPDVSLGSHFFNDLVEADMLYLAIHPTYPGHRIDAARLRAAPNRLAEVVPDDARLAEVVRVVDFPLPGDGRRLWLNASCVGQEVLAYLRAPGEPGAGAAG